jgi:prepilin-type N-terminal cleavage/methylation domain-containing protein
VTGRLRSARRRRGFTLVEVLIATTILLIVFLMTSSGIVSALRTYRVQEDATSSQAKMRRVVEVVTQELRGAVLGGISDFPVPSGSSAVSFTLLSGTGGMLVVDSPAWGTGSTLNLAYDLGPVEESLEGAPALLVNADGNAVVMPVLRNVNSPVGSVSHPTCIVPISFTPNTLLFGVEAIGLEYVAEERILYIHQVVDGNLEVAPFAFGITGFAVEYQYEAQAGVRTDRSTPYTDAAGLPLATYEDGGTQFTLARLKLTLATEANSGGGVREYASFVEMASGGTLDLRSIEACGTLGSPGGGTGPDPEPEPEPEPEPDPPPGGGGGGGKWFP